MFSVLDVAGVYAVDIAPASDRVVDGHAVPRRRAVRTFPYGPALEALGQMRGVVVAEAAFLTGAIRNTLCPIMDKESVSLLPPAAPIFAWGVQNTDDWNAFLGRFAP